MLLVTTLAVAASRRVVSAARSFDPLSSSSDKLVDFVLFFVGFRNRTKTDLLPKPSNHLCIDSVGFSQNAQCFFEVTNLSGIDNRNNMSGTDKFENQAFFVPSGVYEHYQTGLWIRQRFDQY